MSSPDHWPLVTAWTSAPMNQLKLCGHVHRSFLSALRCTKWPTPRVVLSLEVVGRKFGKPR